MASHKCNKCLHQAYVRPESGGDLEYCLVLDKQINKHVRTCSEAVMIDVSKEPDYFINELDGLIKNPTAAEKRKINRIKLKVEKLRAWGKQANKPRIVKHKK